MKNTNAPVYFILSWSSLTAHSPCDRITWHGPVAPITHLKTFLPLDLHLSQAPTTVSITHHSNQGQQLCLSWAANTLERDSRSGGWEGQNDHVSHLQKPKTQALPKAPRIPPRCTSTGGLLPSPHTGPPVRWRTVQCHSPSCHSTANCTTYFKTWN